MTENALKCQKSKRGTDRLEMTLNDQQTQNDSKWLKMTQNDLRWLKNNFKWLKIT